MNQTAIQKESIININASWLFQMVASLSWVISMIAYGSYELGDCLQITAASAWTLSNILSCLNK